jgi:hypothetical protein
VLGQKTDIKGKITDVETKAALNGVTVQEKELKIGHLLLLMDPIQFL